MHEWDDKNVYVRFFYHWSFSPYAFYTVSNNDVDIPWKAAIYEIVYVNYISLYCIIQGKLFLYLFDNIKAIRDLIKVKLGISTNIIGVMNKNVLVQHYAKKCSEYIQSFFHEWTVLLIFVIKFKCLWIRW